MQPGGKYVPKLLCFALVKSWCRSRDKRIKRDRAAEEESGREGGIPRKGKRDEKIQTPGYRRTTRLEKQEQDEGAGEGGGGGVSCAESIILISPGSTGLSSFLASFFSCLFPPSKEPSRAKCSSPSLSRPAFVARLSPPRIDRFEMRELCAAVIPWCDDLSRETGPSNRSLYALVILSRTVAYIWRFSRMYWG